MEARRRIEYLGTLFTTCRRGNVAILFALFLPVIVGAAGFGVETTYWYYKRLAMQAAADSAAYAAALEKRSGGSTSEITVVAELASSQNGFPKSGTAIQVNPASVNGGGSVEVVLTDSAERFFTALFVDSDPVIVTRATASYTNASKACILALSPTASKAANFSGNSNLQLTGCSVMSNSNASDSFNIQGSAILKTTCAIAVGGAHTTSGLTETVCSAPLTGQPAAADPYADVAAPPPTGACKASSAKNETIWPGRYCSGLALKGDIIMQPGDYYIEGSGGFDVNAQANVTGTGVTIYITGGTAKINGGATVTLKAPTSGPRAGILFFGDRSTSGQNKFNGDASSKMTGAIYFAGGEVDYQGNFSGLNGCTQVIGNTVEWTGNTSISVDCSAFGMRDMPVSGKVKLSA
jgi:Flp pilus assembly protein TadG